MCFVVVELGFVVSNIAFEMERYPVCWQYSPLCLTIIMGT